MSIDMVDDLHAAEDLIGLAKVCLEDALGFATRPLVDLFGQLDGYCRPSCGWADTGDCASSADDDFDIAECGCPCRHGQTDEEGSST